jgi:hypothetical protein
MYKKAMYQIVLEIITAILLRATYFVAVLFVMMFFIGVSMPRRNISAPSPAISKSKNFHG